MHIASFDDGSRAALEFFADEMLDLWSHPIVVDGASYYAVVGQILMDGRGRESFCGVQGAGSKAGCNLCHCPSRLFGQNRRVFDSFRRYLPRNDTFRQRDSNKSRAQGLQFAFDDRRGPPVKRTYTDYVTYARIAQDRQNNGLARDKDFAFRGVKKKWPLHVLPYADKIHWTMDMMHTLNNVVTDMLKSIRPTFTGDTTLGRHTNRTTTERVLKGCQDDNIHIHMAWANTVGNSPPWILTKKECVEADKRMLQIIGACGPDESPKLVMKRGHANNSHDTIYWATTYARLVT